MMKWKYLATPGGLVVFDILSVCLRESNNVIFTDVQYVDIQFKCPLYFVSFKIVKFYFCLKCFLYFFSQFLRCIFHFKVEVRFFESVFPTSNLKVSQCKWLLNGISVNLTSNYRS